MINYRYLKQIIVENYNYEEDQAQIIVEELHQELKDVISSSQGTNKHTVIANKLKDLTSRGESTGVEGSMPKGSSRAYLKHDKPEDVVIDGKKVKLQTGTKVAIRAGLDKYHDHKFFGGSLGQMQNQAENGEFSNSHKHRILEKTGKNRFKTNVHGMFPPLLDHDEANNHWSHVGHVDNITKREFQKLTKTKDFPKGITHQEFHEALTRDHDRGYGKYWEGSEEHEKNLDRVINHPLVEKFNIYHSNTGEPPHDYQQIKNLGVFNHPNGTKHIIARDHGYDEEVRSAYQRSLRKKYASQR